MSQTHIWANEKTHLCIQDSLRINLPESHIFFLFYADNRGIHYQMINRICWRRIPNWRCLKYLCGVSLLCSTSSFLQAGALPPSEHLWCTDTVEPSCLGGCPLGWNVWTQAHWQVSHRATNPHGTHQWGHHSQQSYKGDALESDAYGWMEYRYKGKGSHCWRQTKPNYTPEGYGKSFQVQGKPPVCFCFLQSEGCLVACHLPSSQPQVSCAGSVSLPGSNMTRTQKGLHCSQASLGFVFWASYVSWFYFVWGHC